jgi:hypothetical protein
LPPLFLYLLTNLQPFLEKTEEKLSVMIYYLLRLCKTLEVENIVYLKKYFVS